MLGIVTRVWSNFYDVYDYENKIIKKVQAPGNFKHRKITIIPGDKVEIGNWNDKIPLISVVLPRKNSFYRPKIANIEHIFLVFSFVNPEVHFYLFEKMVAYFEFQKISVSLILTKSDLITPDVMEKVIANFADFDNKKISIINFHEKNTLRKHFEKRLTKGVAVLTGPSGVGKSTIINGLNPSFSREIGICEKIRGNHTTKEVALFELASGVFLADTPGFSKFEFRLKPQELAKSFRSFAFFSQFCKYNNCAHTSEPDCGIRSAVSNNFISKKRYANYLKMQEELKNGKN